MIFGSTEKECGQFVIKIKIEGTPTKCPLFLLYAPNAMVLAMWGALRQTFQLPAN